MFNSRDLELKELSTISASTTMTSLATPWSPDPPSGFSTTPKTGGGHRTPGTPKLPRAESGTNVNMIGHVAKS